jgi:tetratricopeptide (TPR) repeat protein
MNPVISKMLTAFLAVGSVILTGTGLATESADELIRNGDVFYAKLQAAEALKFYLLAEKIEPKNVRLLVHISREYRHLMSDASALAEKRRLGGIAVNYANRAAALGPSDADAQLAVAISYGLLQPLEGSRDRIDASRIVKAAADKTLKLDPNSDLGWHVLGRWHMAIANVSSFQRTMAQVVFGQVLPQSTYGEAVTCFEKAIKLNPNRLIHYIELGRVYAQMGRSDEARRFITKGLAMQDTEKDDSETKRQGRELLAQLH